MHGVACVAYPRMHLAMQHTFVHPVQQQHTTLACPRLQSVYCCCMTLTDNDRLPACLPA
jgi:hypothetical protein